MRALTSLGIVVACLFSALPAGAQWSDLSTTPSDTDGRIHDLQYYGGDLYAGGEFTQIGGVTADRVARWDGAAWNPVSGGIQGKVFSMQVHDDGSGERLFVAGDFTTATNGTTPVTVNGVAAWDGATWSAVGTGTVAYGFTEMTEWDGDLVITWPDVMRWDGASWTLVATSLPFATCAADFDGDLHVGVQPNRLFRATGSTWTEVLPNPLTSFPHDMIEFREDLYIGSRSSSSTIWMLRYVAGSPVWTTPDGPTTGDVLALEQVGQCGLYAYGIATSASTTLPNIGRWNGGSWAALGTGLNIWSNAQALAARVVGANVELAVGGEYATAGGLPAENVAQWEELYCGAAGTPYCTAGLTTNGCLPSISGNGLPSATAASQFFIRIDQVEGQKQGILFYGVSGPAATPWGMSTSFLCVKAPTQRTGAQGSGGTAGSCDGTLFLDWNSYQAANPGALGNPFSGGDTVWAQGWFRDPPSPKTTNLSDGLEFTLLP